MRTTSFAIIALSAVAGLWWGVQRNEAAQLRIERERLQQESAGLRRLRQEHDRLLRLQPSDEEATEFVRIKNPAGVTCQVHLTLHGSAEGWKLKVPPYVVDNIVASLPGAGKR